MSSERHRLPLEGIRVLDLSNLLAGPLTATHLADFGAEVIKVEHPHRPDELRKWGHQKDGQGLFWKVVARNKKLITLDLSHEIGREIAADLAAKSDVVIENFRTGTLARWGLGYDVLSARNPGLVMAHVTGYGQTGPYARKPGFGTVADGFSGYAAITGYADREPLLASFGLGDASTSIFTAFAVMVALRHRDQTGEGQEVDSSLYEGLFTLIGSNVIDYDQLGLVQPRNGSRLPFVVPRNAYETKDGKWLAIAGSTQGTFERLVSSLGLEDLLVDPRFATNQERMVNADQLDSYLKDAILERSEAEMLDILDHAEAAGGPVYDIRDIYADPQYAARGNIARVDDPDLGPVRMQNVVPRLTKSPGRIRHTGRAHGQDNSLVYSELLGFDATRLKQLSDEGVI